MLNLPEIKQTFGFTGMKLSRPQWSDFPESNAWMVRSPSYLPDGFLLNLSFQDDARLGPFRPDKRCLVVEVDWVAPPQSLSWIWSVSNHSHFVAMIGLSRFPSWQARQGRLFQGLDSGCRPLQHSRAGSHYIWYEFTIGSAFLLIHVRRMCSSTNNHMATLQLSRKRLVSFWRYRHRIPRRYELLPFGFRFGIKKYRQR
jgi:hypothetical protein